MKFMVIEGCVSRTIDRRLVNLGNILQEGWFLGLVRFRIIAAILAGHRIVLACTMFVCLNLSAFGNATNTVDSPEKAWTAYTQAQRQFQQELADFFTSRCPELKDLIHENRDLQLALIDRRSLEFRYLLSTHPERIVKNEGISRFTNYGWNEEDQNTLRRSSQEYEAALKRVAELRKRSDEDLRWPIFRAAQKALEHDPEFQRIYERQDERTKAAEKLLEGRRRS